MESRADITTPVTKPNCYQCIHRRPTIGDAHSRCAHPSIVIPEIELIATMLNMERPEKTIHIIWNEHGWRNGWFMWPVNFDPIWLESCTGFEPLQPL